MSITHIPPPLIATFLRLLRSLPPTTTHVYVDGVQLSVSPIYPARISLYLSLTTTTEVHTLVVKKVTANLT